jgi:hypothetical protein
MRELIIEQRRALRRYFRWPRVLWRGFVCPTFSMLEALAVLALLGFVHVAIVDQLSYVALVCAESFTR